MEKTSLAEDQGKKIKKLFKRFKGMLNDYESEIDSIFGDEDDLKDFSSRLKTVVSMGTKILKNLNCGDSFVTESSLKKNLENFESSLKKKFQDFELNIFEKIFASKPVEIFQNVPTPKISVAEPEMTKKKSAENLIEEKEEKIESEMNNEQIEEEKIIQKIQEKKLIKESVTPFDSLMEKSQQNVDDKIQGTPFDETQDETLLHSDEKVFSKSVFIQQSEKFELPKESSTNLENEEIEPDLEEEEKPKIELVLEEEEFNMNIKLKKPKRRKCLLEFKDKNNFMIAASDIGILSYNGEEDSWSENKLKKNSKFFFNIK